MSPGPDRFDDRPTIGERPLEAIGALVGLTFVATLSLLVGQVFLLVVCLGGGFLVAQHLYELACDGQRYRHPPAP